MGKVRDIVHRDIPRGPTIACSVASDFLLTAGVSNWGGYAVAVGLYLVSTCPIHERYRRRAVGFPPSDEDRQQYRSALPNVDRVGVNLYCLLWKLCLLYLLALMLPFFKIRSTYFLHPVNYWAVFTPYCHKISFWARSHPAKSNCYKHFVAIIRCENQFKVNELPDKKILV